MWGQKNIFRIDPARVQNCPAPGPGSQGCLRRRAHPGRPGGPRENSGTTEPATVPVVPLFSLPPKRGGHNSQKRGTGPGTGRGLSTGIIEVIISRIWIAEVRPDGVQAVWGSGRRPDLRFGSRKRTERGQVKMTEYQYTDRIRLILLSTYDQFFDFPS